MQDQALHSLDCRLMQSAIPSQVRDTSCVQSSQCRVKMWKLLGQEDGKAVAEISMKIHLAGLAAVWLQLWKSKTEGQTALAVSKIGQTEGGPILAQGFTWMPSFSKLQKIGKDECIEDRSVCIVTA